MAENHPITGVLINNLGTPASPGVSDVRAFLKQFLSDPRVIRVPRPIWWLILNVIILNTRPKRSAEAYQEIWTDQGSPLLAISQSQVKRLQSWTQSGFPYVRIEPGMRYGAPSIEQGLDRLRQAGATRYLIMPMYPQYSTTTTASTKDEVLRVFESWQSIPEFKFVCQYFDEPQYIEALNSSVEEHWQKNGQSSRLLMSFHGIPEQYSRQGDPYGGQCESTAKLLAEKLGLDPEQWILSFQSRLGPKKWLGPYTDHTLREMARQGVESVDVICPGFSVDCLETLEEIAIRDKQLFLDSGGKAYSYIPCLNDRQQHIEMIGHLIKNHIQ